MGIRELSEKLWSGEHTTSDLGHMLMFQGIEGYGRGLWFVGAFANVVALETGEGLVLVDTGSFFAAGQIRAAVREQTQAPLHTAIYTHGHIDHVMGTRVFEEEARPNGAPAPRVIGHQAVAARFDRYKLTAGWNGAINSRQFGLPGLAWPTNYRYPDQTYTDALTLELGGTTIELHHARGETDDHTWLWLPAHRTVCTGDLFIWASPNCGNPQKVQRYPREWAIALRKMATLAPALLLPGHGPPIEGEARVAQALAETAELLETLHDGVLALMNQGAKLDDVVANVHAPERLTARPYLRPVYDDPEFIVRALWRLYGGWWDGQAAHLKPPREAAVAREVAALAGGATALIDRARAAATTDLALACQLADWAASAAPGDPGVRAVRKELYLKRAEGETSLMARSIFRAASEE